MDRRRRRLIRYTVSARQQPWLITYGDIVTLLLSFFVLLFSFSSIDIGKFNVAISSLQGAFGILPGGRTIQPVPEPLESESRKVQTPEPFILDWQQLEEAKQQLQQKIREANLEGTVVIELEERGLVIRFADTVLFDLGKADLKPEAQNILNGVAEVLKTLPNQVRVEGHTDNLPIHTERFPSNWELSTARATNVVRYLIEEQGLDPVRLSAAGYGEYRPIAPNDSEANRKKNRRVDVVIMHVSTVASEPVGQDTSNERLETPGR